MGILHLGLRVLIDLPLKLGNFLGLRQTCIHHVLVVLNEGHISLELGVEMILALAELVTLLLEGGPVAPLPCLLYTSPSPRDLSTSRMPSSA